ncbi:winged helix-turn-helix domain-containing protein [Streptosporangium sp. NPDC000095]|uniref:winged helix-turn-helix domain-containing protein n=1 Tax=Streptosporangium sp. NPDC000095 TaxID=3366184 RepID=UPI00369DE8FB
MPRQVDHDERRRKLTEQRRIEVGDYPPGSMLLSENQLINEFGVSRPTVVAALRVLREQGWVESQQGKGRFVRRRRGRTTPPRTGLPDRPGNRLSR